MRRGLPGLLGTVLFLVIVAGLPVVAHGKYHVWIVNRSPHNYYWKAYNAEDNARIIACAADYVTARRAERIPPGRTALIDAWLPWANTCGHWDVLSFWVERTDGQKSEFIPHVDWNHVIIIDPQEKITIKPLDPPWREPEGYQPEWKTDP